MKVPVINSTVKPPKQRTDKFLGSDPEDYFYWASPVISGINIVLGLISVIAITSFLLQYGFNLSAQFNAVLNRIDLLIVQFYFWQFLSKLALSRSKLNFLKRRWFESGLALMIFFETAIIIRVVGFDLIGKYFSDVNVTTITEIYIGLAQILIILTLITEGIKYNTRVASLRFHPSQTMILSFILVIIVGTGLLMLPRATAPGHSISLLDAFFTSTSATCVTGLIVVDTATNFSQFGQIIILALIQIGGLGIMTLSSFLALFFGQGVGIRERVILHQMMNIDKIGLITSMLRNAVLITLGIEAAGALVLMALWSDQGWTLGQLIYRSVFHSISAFCNAGFSTFSNSLLPFQNDPGVLMCFSVLIILGGLGFIVLLDIAGAQVSWRKKYRIKMQTRMVLVVSAILLAGGFISLFLLNKSNMGGTRLLTAFFNSVTARTAGFNTTDIGSLSIPSVLIIMMLMFIGASPGSTGGGIKTTTIGVLWTSIIAIITGQNRIIIYKRRLPFLVLNRALVVFAFSVMFVALSVLLLSITENARSIDVAFEAVSAFGTVGLSRGLTPHLTIPGKLIIIISMFVGRLGALTLAFAITSPEDQPAFRIEYPSEAVMIG